MWWYRVLMSYRSHRRRAGTGFCFSRTFRSGRYRYGCFIDTGTNSGTYVHTGTVGAGIIIDVVPNLPKSPAPVLMSYRTYRSVRYRYPCRTELAEVSGTGIDVVQNLPKSPAPVLMSYRTYRSVWYRYWCRTELNEVSGTGNTAGIYRRYPSVRNVPNTPLVFCLPSDI